MIFGTLGRIVLASKFCRVGVALLGARALQKRAREKVRDSIPAAARGLSTSCLILMMKRMLLPRGIIRRMRRRIKMMNMKMRFRVNLRMIKDDDDKG